MTIFAYLIVTFWMWDVLWLADISTFPPADRVTFLVLAVAFVFVDFNIFKLWNINK